MILILIIILIRLIKVIIIIIIIMIKVRISRIQWLTVLCERFHMHNDLAKCFAICEKVYPIVVLAYYSRL